MTNMAGKPKVDVAAMKRVLVARREELETLIAHGEAQRTDTDLEQQREGRLARMDALQRLAVDQETGRRRANEHSRILAALERVEKDDYGWCTACGDPIVPKRLENDPSAALCIECARKAD